MADSKLDPGLTGYGYTAVGVGLIVSVAARSCG